MKLKLTRPIAFLDVESTGTDPVNDRVISIAIIRLGADCKPFGLPYHSLVNPRIPIPPESTEIHGITDDMVKHAPMFLDIVKEIEYHLHGADIGGYSAGHFDIPILYEEAIRADHELKCLLEAKIIDPGIIFKKREERSLSAAVKFFCGREMEGAHNALNDVRATIDVLAAQFERYPDLPTDLDKLAEYSRFNDNLTFDGKIIRDKDGDAVYNFGKSKGTKVKDDLSFAYWILSKDFPTQTRRVLSKIVDGIEAEMRQPEPQPELIPAPADDVPF